MEFRANPRNTVIWERRALELGLDPDSLNIHDNNHYPSASKLKEVDFLHLKILWVKKPEDDLDALLRQCIHPQRWKTARDLYKASLIIGRILQDVTGEHYDAFSPAIQLQSLVNRLDLNYMASRETKKVGMLPEVLTTMPRRSKRLMDRLNDTRATVELESQMGELSITIESPKTPEKKDVEAETSLLPFSLSPVSPGGMTPFDSKTADEEIVNVALATFLLSVVTIVPRLRSRVQWLPNRKRFFVGYKLCEARTDGYLKALAPKHDVALALLEVKPFIRSSHEWEIQWQEGAQMAAWISETLKSDDSTLPDTGLLYSSEDGLKRRLLISQNHKHIFITVAEYGALYEKHLFGGDLPATLPTADQSPSRKAVSDSGQPTASNAGWKDNGFLTMRCYGPIDASRRSRLVQIGAIITALTLELADSGLFGEIEEGQAGDGHD